MSIVAPDTHKLLRYMPSVQRQQNDLRLVEAAWDNLALLSALSRLTSQTSSGSDLGRARKDFSALASEMVHGLAQEALATVVQDLTGKAQVGVDILVRNLFERTADIGFLATDEVLTAYATDTTSMSRETVEQRLAHYASFYSVYQAIQVFDAQLVRVASHPSTGAGDESLSISDRQFLNTVLQSDSAYTEHYGRVGFFDAHAPSLVYAKRLLADGQPVGVLCLQFRIADELPSIFGVLLDDGRDSSVVLALLDTEQRVIGASDPLQLPTGWRVGHTDGQACGVVRHMGREYLMCLREGQPFEGYPGPGWRGLAMVPLDLAFEQTEAHTSPSPLMDEVASHPGFLSGDLKKIPERSTAIQTALERSVWNGLLDINRVELAAGMGESDIQFAKTLLSEIGSTAQKTARAFANALHDLHRVVTHAVVGDAQHRATMAMQILDRNLYERANDCRWWALTPSLVRALQTPDRFGAEASATLHRINDLYTVYSGIVLFDAQGRVTAVSRSHLAPHLGHSLDEPWVRLALALDEGAYTASEWAPTRLQAKGNTFVYAAALRDPGNHRVLGGIGLVWHGASQLRSILHDCAAGSAPQHAFMLLDSQGRVAMAHGPSHSESHVQQALASTRNLPPGEAIADLGNTLHGVGVSQGVGYREFRLLDGHSHGLRCVALYHLCHRLPQARDWRSLKVARTSGPQGLASVVRLATFTAGGHWLALPVELVQFAAPDTQILSVAHMRQPLIGMVHLDGHVYPVLDLRCAILGAMAGEAVRRQVDVTRQLMVVRVPVGNAQHTEMALRADALTAIVEVAATSLQKMSHGASVTGMIDHVVGVNMEAPSRPGGDPGVQALLMVLSRTWLQQCARGAMHATAPQDLQALTGR